MNIIFPDALEKGNLSPVLRLQTFDFEQKNVMDTDKFLDLTDFDFAKGCFVSTSSDLPPVRSLVYQLARRMVRYYEANPHDKPVKVVAMTGDKNRLDSSRIGFDIVVQMDEQISETVFESGNRILFSNQDTKEGAIRSEEILKKVVALGKTGKYHVVLIVGGDLVKYEGENTFVEILTSYKELGIVPIIVSPTGLSSVFFNKQIWDAIKTHVGNYFVSPSMDTFEVKPLYEVFDEEMIKHKFIPDVESFNCKIVDAKTHESRFVTGRMPSFIE